MNYDPIPYKPYEREPVGIFTAEMTMNGWGNTKFDHGLEEHLLSDEVAEFTRLVHHIFYGVCKDWQALQRFSQKYGTEAQDDSYNTCLAMNFEGEVMDYIVSVKNTFVQIAPYRKTKHRNIGRFER